MWDSAATAGRVDNRAVEAIEQRLLGYISAVRSSNTEHSCMSDGVVSFRVQYGDLLSAYVTLLSIVTARHTRGHPVMCVCVHLSG